VTLVPKSVYRLLKLSVNLAVAKSARLELGFPTTCSDPARTLEPGILEVAPTELVGTETGTNIERKTYYSCIQRQITLPNQIYRWVAGSPYIRTELVLSEISPQPGPYPQVRSFLGDSRLTSGTFNAGLSRQLETKYNLSAAYSDAELLIPA